MKKSLFKGEMSVRIRINRSMAPVSPNQMGTSLQLVALILQTMKILNLLLRNDVK